VSLMKIVGNILRNNMLKFQSKYTSNDEGNDFPSTRVDLENDTENRKSKSILSFNLERIEL